MRRLFFLGAGVALAMGCASTEPNFSAVQNPAIERAVVYVYRPKRTVIGAAGWIEVSVDGKSLGKLWNGNYVVYSGSPGKHLFQYRYSHPIAGPALVSPPNSASSDGPRVELVLDGGQIYYLEYPAPKLVDAGKGLNDLKNCHTVGVNRD